MKLKQLLEQLNQLAKERPEALEMEVDYEDFEGDGGHSINSIYIYQATCKKGVILSHFGRPELVK